MSELLVGDVGGGGATMSVEICAVVDTNVFLEIFSCTALLAETDGITRLPKFDYRATRARESLLLAQFFHWQHATTLGLLHEQVRMLEAFAPPDQMEEFNSGFTTVFIHFVKEMVLSDWINASVPQSS